MITKSCGTIVAIILLWVGPVLAQEKLRGTVSGPEGDKIVPLPGVVLRWENSMQVVLTDKRGSFQLPVEDSLPKLLLISYTGFESDTVLVKTVSQELKIVLGEARELQQVEVKGKRESTEISTMRTLNVEKLNEAELLKAACCNLSESFETNPSVDVSYTDALTGAKEIQLLGLSGIYTQILTENLPNLRGLAVPFGMGFVPGPWLESISISKGAGSVTNGYEAMTGQINVEFKKPEDAPRWFFNAFGDTEGRTEVNSIYSTKLNKHWSYMLMLHGSGRANKMDRNDDGFLDQPKYGLVNAYNRFRYHSGEKLEGQFGVRLIVDDRIGGQKQFNEDTDKLTTNSYGFRVTTRRAEIYSKTGLIYPNTPWKSMGLQNSFIFHDQEGYFGLRTYNGRQFSYYGNYSYMTILGTTDHRLKSGVDFRYDKFEESVSDSAFPLTQYGPGLFAEYSYSCEESPLGIIAGIRGDYDNLFGYTLVPRLHVKYNFSDNLVVRLSGGRGLRTPHPYADNIGLFVSSKQLIMLETPGREDAWNGGINITTRFRIHGREGSLSLDAYGTTFENQLVMDQYSRQDAVLYYNLQGNSTATSLQATLSYELRERLFTKLAYKVDDVQTDYRLVAAEAKPLLARNKALVRVGYVTKKEFWRFDVTIQWEGVKPLPLAASPEGLTVPREYSDDYTMLTAQVTRVFKRWELYFGGENLLGMVQKNPILSPENPFGNTFDATRVWGPINRQKGYAGIRLTFN
jgi:outer membrane cobalamin receptor